MRRGNRQICAPRNTAAGHSRRRAALCMWRGVLDHASTQNKRAGSFARARGAESCAHGAPPERTRTVLEHLQQRQAGDVHLLGSVHERCVDLGRAAHPHARLIEHTLEALHGRWQGARALLRPTPAAGLTPRCRRAHERERARRSPPAPTPDPRASVALVAPRCAALPPPRGPSRRAGVFGRSGAPRHARAVARAGTKNACVRAITRAPPRSTSKSTPHVLSHAARAPDGGARFRRTAPLFGGPFRMRSDGRRAPPARPPLFRSMRNRRRSLEMA